MTHDEISALSDFTHAALGTLLWSETDETDPNGSGGEEFVYGNYASALNIDLSDFDFDPVGLAELASDCRSFAAEVAEAGLSDLLPEDSIAQDFILTRNGHGTGFWDRGLGEDGERLTKMSKAYGTVGLYRGDDGRIYFHN